MSTSPWRSSSSDAAERLGVSWNLVKAIVNEELQRRCSRPRLRDLQWIAIDEISIEGGHRHLTVVLDLDSGAVVFVGEDKRVDAPEPFLEAAPCCASRAEIRAVATDMSEAYIRAVRDHFRAPPWCSIAFTS